MYIVCFNDFYICFVDVVLILKTVYTLHLILSLNSVYFIYSNIPHFEFSSDGFNESFGFFLPCLCLSISISSPLGQRERERMTEWAPDWHSPERVTAHKWSRSGGMAAKKPRKKKEKNHFLTDVSGLRDNKSITRKKKREREKKSRELRRTENPWQSVKQESSEWISHSVGAPYLSAVHNAISYQLLPPLSRRQAPLPR